MKPTSPDKVQATVVLIRVGWSSANVSRLLKVSTMTVKRIRAENRRTVASVRNQAAELARAMEWED